tara:strand:- start:2364 stop:2624 length:261 start_codon:yes stop_codon:yes gene_type:complete
MGVPSGTLSFKEEIKMTGNNTFPEFNRLDVDDIFNVLQDCIQAACSHHVHERADSDDRYYFNKFLHWARSTGHDVPCVGFDEPEEG